MKICHFVPCTPSGSISSLPLWGILEGDRIHDLVEVSVKEIGVLRNLVHAAQA